jgi:hypothetical protein
MRDFIASLTVMVVVVAVLLFGPVVDTIICSGIFHKVASLGLKSITVLIGIALSALWIVFVYKLNSTISSIFYGEENKRGTKLRLTGLTWLISNIVLAIGSNFIK